MSLYKVTCIWEGFPSAPGTNTFYLDSAPADVDMFADFYDGFKDALPPSVSVNVVSEGVIIDEATGDLEGAWSAGTGSIITGTGGSDYAAGVGGICRWLTADVVNSRLVKGRSFIAPLSETEYGNNGKLTNASIANLQSAAATLRTALGSSFQVWARPFEGTVDNPERVGTKHAVTGHVTPARICSLRSRR